MSLQPRTLPSPGLPQPYRLGDDEFDLFRELVERETGIQMPPSKRPLLISRLARRLRELQLGSFEAYFRRVTVDGDAAERVRMIDHLTTNETCFFRETAQFEHLERRILPAWAAGARRRSIRVWSAACSTGEEPFSIAMMLLSLFPGWDIEICASDLSTRVLDQARAALWPIERRREIPEPYLKRFMLRGVGEFRSLMKARSELRACVTFQQINLHDARYPLEGAFDFIYCRNVLIYFSAEGRKQVVDRLIDRLAPGGFLLLGHAETANGLTERLASRGSAIYSHSRDLPARPARKGAAPRSIFFFQEKPT
jgi:chemotaxis protein methyltransferase CheR